MKLKNVTAFTAILSLLGALSGCATTADTASAETKKKPGPEGSGKAERKISQAIGEEIGAFKIVSRAEGDSAPAGFSEGVYTILTNTGVKYKCSILEPSGFMNAMSFGGAGSAGAMCTNFTAGSKDQGKTNKASCNELLKAAGKC